MGTWMKNIRRVEPYVPGEQPLEKDIIKLNTNENPYPPSSEVLKAAEDIALNGADALRKYPDPNISKLVQTLSAYHGVWPENVFVGVGSDDVLSVAFQTFFNSNKPILFPDVTYSFYPVWAELYGISYKRMPLKGDFRIDINDYLIPNGGIIIANPNAPTGISLSLKEIEAIVESNKDSVVIIDEAYVDFGGESAISLIDGYDNLLVVRTFSKSRSLAGLRVGYAMGSKELIKAMSDVKFSINSYTLNAPAINMGVASVKDDDYFRENLSKIKETRKKTVEGLEFAGFKVLPSDANFVFASHNRHKAKDIFEGLKKKKIYVRHFGQDRIDNYLRISIGTDEDMSEFLRQIRNVTEELSMRF